MPDIAPDLLKKIGLDTARGIIGGDIVTDLEVSLDQDFAGDPIYSFQYKILEYRDRRHLSQLQTRLSQALRDTLVRSGDDHYPMIRMLSAHDWERRRA